MWLNDSQSRPARSREELTAWPQALKPPAVEQEWLPIPLYACRDDRAHEDSVISRSQALRKLTVRPGKGLSEHWRARDGNAVRHPGEGRVDQGSPSGEPVGDELLLPGEDADRENVALCDQVTGAGELVDADQDEGRVQRDGAKRVDSHSIQLAFHAGSHDHHPGCQTAHRLTEAGFVD